MDELISLEVLTAQVMAFFRANAGRYGLLSNQLSVEYILNWGGFVNASFKISDGERAYHLKLADDEDRLMGLERWRDLHEILEAHYHAPLMLDWIEIEDTDFEGPLFEYIEGQRADLYSSPVLFKEVLALVAQLHADSDLSARLIEMDDPPESCADYFIGVYIDRFDEDLLIIVRDLPPFVSLKTLDWMQGETRHLESLARELPSFEPPAAAPVHGDLWPGNLIVTASGSWYLIDWDDLSLGDPALEYGILFAPIWRQHPETDLIASGFLPPEISTDARLRERFTVCLRASLLDEVIDTLADYVEADFAPEHQEFVKKEKMRFHLEAFEKYQQIYGRQ